MPVLPAGIGLLMILKILPQRLADIFDMGLEQRASCIDLTAATEAQEFGMLDFGSLHAVRE
jgi:hypothetical protein